MSETARVIKDSSVDNRTAKRRKKELLDKAVHNNKATSKEGILERMFSFAFRGFVYPQIWEDPEIDIEAMALDSSSRILTISSGGCNVMNYLTENPEHITAVDLNPAHIALLRLKICAVKHLPDYETFFRFFGHANDPLNIKIYDRYLAPHLDGESRAFWEQKAFFGLGKRPIEMFAENVYRFGLLGRFISSVHILAKLYGQDPRDILMASTLEEQTDIFNRTLGPVFEKKLVRRLCNMPVSLYGLGIPPAQFEELLKAADGDVAKLLKERLRRLACDYPINDNYYAWQAFGRGYDTLYRRAVPRYLSQKQYETLKANIDKVETHNTILTDMMLEKPDGFYNRYVFLDAQDWMNQQQLTELWSEVTRTAGQGARVIFRTAGHDSPLEKALPDEIMNRWEPASAEQCEEWTKRDRSSIYGKFHLYTFKG